MSTQSPFFESPFLYLKEVAGYLKCSVKSVRRYIDDGKISAHRLRGRVVIKSENLKRFINQLPEER